MQTSTTSPMSKIVIGLLAGGAMLLAFSSTACSVTVTADCGAGFDDCDGVCRDLSSDPDNCGACGNSCGADICDNGTCGTTACIGDGDSCTTDDDCCSLFCQTSNGQCGCITEGDDTQYCNDDGDCCSGNCDADTGYCQ